MSLRFHITISIDIDIAILMIMVTTMCSWQFQEQRKSENQGVTEDDVDEIKSDISAFRFHILALPWFESKSRINFNIF